MCLLTVPHLVYLFGGTGTAKSKEQSDETLKLEKVQHGGRWQTVVGRSGCSRRKLYPKLPRASKQEEDSVVETNPWSEAQHKAPTATISMLGSFFMPDTPWRILMATLGAKTVSLIQDAMVGSLQINVQLTDV